MEQLVVSANNLFDFAIAQYENAVAAHPDLTAEEHFDGLVTSLDNFLDAADNRYLEDMEDHLAAVVAAVLGISMTSKLFTEPIDPEELV